MNLPQWITMIALAVTAFFLVLIAMNLRYTGRILARKEPDLLDRAAAFFNHLLPGS